MVDFIVRKTYGWHKQTDAIPLSQFCLATCIKKTSIIRAIHKAENHGIVYRLVNGHYGLHRDFTSWKPFTRKRIVYQDVNIVYQDVNKSFTKKRPSIDTTKDTSSKDIISPPQKPKAISDIQKIVEHFKTIKGYSGREWDALNFSRHVKTAKKLLDAIGSYDLVIQAIDSGAEWFTEKGLDWTMETIAKRIGDFKKEADTFRPFSDAEKIEAGIA